MTTQAQALKKKRTNNTKEDLCFWTLCTAKDNTYTGCYEYGNGVRADLARAAVRLPWKASKLFVAECIKPNETTNLDWERRISGFPLIERQP